MTKQKISDWLETWNIWRQSSRKQTITDTDMYPTPSPLLQNKSSSTSPPPPNRVPTPEENKQTTIPVKTIFPTKLEE